MIASARERGVGKIALQTLLYGASLVYRSVVSARNWCYDRGILPAYRVPLPVVSIGNITAGGNAKTPLCDTIAHELRSHGFMPVVLSRGYGGSCRGPYQVRKEDAPSLVGDEPLLLARALSMPVVVARDRVAGARFIVNQNLGDVIILDDGFQHRRLKRDVDIISANISTPEAVNSFLEGSLLPLGRFREPRKEALCRAHFLIFSERTIRASLPELDARLLKELPQHLMVLRSALEPVAILPLQDYLAGARVGEIGPANLQRPFIAFCSIANPEGFLQSLSALNLTIVAHRVFPDHYAATDAELTEFSEAHADAALLCTEKDAVKLSHSVLQDKVYVLLVRTSLIPAEPFFRSLFQSLEKVQNKVQSASGAI